MADNCLDFAKRETARLNMEIEVLQGEIFLHNETKDAWDTIVRNAGSESHATYMDLANAEMARLNGKIEAVQEKIRLHNETMDAWNTIIRNAGSKSRIFRDVTYVSGEDGQWHLRRLEMEIEALQGEIRLHNETKAAWDSVVRSAGSEPDAAFLEVVDSEMERLNGEVEAVQDKIRRHLETRDAWDTIMRNAGSQTRIYQGASYVRGEDGQWHLQQTQPIVSIEDDDRRWTSNAVSKVDSVLHSLLDASEKTFRGPRKHLDFSGRGKEQFQSLGLR
jgi:hypothetical protein